VHPLGVQIHAAIESVLPVVESRHGLPWYRSLESLDHSESQGAFFKQLGLSSTAMTEHPTLVTNVIPCAR
jgi:hypothetical protein